MSAIAIATHNLTHRFGRHRALNGLDLQVERGSIYGFVGPNGAGKTTTLRILAGLLEPTGGSVALMGSTARPGAEADRRLVGYMPDFFGVYDDLRVWEYLDFFARCYGLPPARRRSVVDQLLELVDLAPRRNSFVQTLSRGMQQRLCLAHALVHDPPILLLDEPASGLDPRARIELRELLRTLQGLGKTILLSSHILPELGELCTHVGVIEAGRMRLSVPMADIWRMLREGHQLVVRMLGGAEPAIDLLRAHPGVRSARVVPEAPDQLLVEYTGDDAVRVELLRLLVGAGLAVADFGTREAGLEDLFMRLTEAAQ